MKKKKKAAPAKPRPNPSPRPDPEAQPEHRAPFPIVGIGASAGGLEAFEKFFSRMPPDSGLAFVLIPHLDPSHASLMTELLRRSTRMEVREAEDGQRVEANRVYVIPPNKEMSVYHGVLSLEAPKKSHGLRMPIDSFFRSLAEDQGENAICVILSGTGTDGTLGLRAVHGAGGICIVQSPATAKYGGMPGSAIATGLADLVLTPEEIPAQLVSLVKKAAGKRGLAQVVEKEGNHFLRKILMLIRSQTGHDFSLYKKTTLRRRIEKRMNLHNLENVGDYVKLLQEKPDEVRLLFKDMIIGVTNFFRDPEAFSLLRKKILPSYLEDKPDGYSFRVWIPGCGTGEEAYSLGMVAVECMEDLNRNFKVQIFGTDIDEEAIVAARSGSYSDNIVSDVAPERLRRFFVKEEDQFRIKKEIREMTVFAVQDVTKDPPFTKLDLLSCRNLLIYLEAELQNRLLPLFHYSMKAEGILFLGSSETIGKYADLFTVLDKRWKVFKSRKVLTRVQEDVFLSLPWVHTPYPAEEPEEGRKPARVDVPSLAQRALLENFAPPSVVVNGKGDILYVHGQTGKYLEPAPGHASLNVLDMSREGIRLELRSAFHQALTRGKERRFSNLQVKTNGGWQKINLTVKPLPLQGENQGLMLVSFEDVLPPRRGEAAREKARAPEKRDKRLLTMEQELNLTRETLQATIEELQASNEELKSTNEELQSTNEEFQSTNEELETSREELQSMNEELITVNSELQAKIDQLSQAEVDMKILLDNTKIGIIFLDARLRIIRFTAEATHVFNLIPTDVGRPLHDIRSNLEYDQLKEDAEAVLASLQAREVEVRAKNGSWYLMRVLPYRTAENLIDGVVLTLVNITSQKGKDLFRAVCTMVQTVAESVRHPLLVLDKDFKAVAANPLFFDFFRTKPADTEGRTVFDLAGGQWREGELRSLLEETLRLDRAVENFEASLEVPGAGRKRFLLNARRVFVSEGNQDPLILLALEERPA